jgi:hypothetical protein
MRVEKREFAWEFSQLSCSGQTRTRVAWELMRVETWEFSQLSCSGQTRTRVAWNDESWLDITDQTRPTGSSSHQLSWNLNQLKVDKSAREWTKVGDETRARVTTFIWVGLYKWSLYFFSYYDEIPREDWVQVKMMPKTWRNIRSLGYGILNFLIIKHICSVE